MILIEKRTGIEVDIAELERRVTQSFKGIRDERLVKPKRFKIGDIDKEGILNGIFTSEEDIEHKVTQCNGKILWSRPKYAEGDEAGYDAVFKSVAPKQTELVHQAPIYAFFKDRTFSENADYFATEKVIGPKPFRVKNRLGYVIGRPTYLKEDGTSPRDYLGGGNEFCVKEDLDNGKIRPVWAYWLFGVSVPELMKTRTIFFDPEGVDSEHEFGKTYIIFGGIPLQAVTNSRIEVITPKGDKVSR